MFPEVKRKKIHSKKACASPDKEWKCQVTGVRGINYIQLESNMK